MLHYQLLFINLTIYCLYYNTVYNNKEIKFIYYNKRKLLNMNNFAIIGKKSILIYTILLVEKL